MRVFLAGASGVIGVRLVPLLIEGGHLAVLEAPSGVVEIVED